ncbi:MAG: acetolactate synthase small subunit [Atopobiaceae bacterium]
MQEDQNQATRRSLSVLVDNEAGVLSQVARMFSRKGYNIESLAVGTTADPSVSRITIEVIADDPHIELLGNQLRKLLAVHSVKLLDPTHSIRRELVLIKIATNTSEVCNRVIQIANIFRASVIDVSSTTITLALIGEESKTDAIVDLVREFGILELVRTGMVAIERGTRTIYDQTKERGEFDYGKNVLREGL